MFGGTQWPFALKAFRKVEVRPSGGCYLSHRHFDRLSDRMLEPGSFMSGLALQVAEPTEATKQNGHRAR